MIINVLLIILIVILVFLIYRYVNFWSRRQIPGPNFIEFISSFSSEQHKYNMKMNEKFGKVYGNVFLTHKMLTINDPEIIKLILTKHFEAFPDHINWNTGPGPYVQRMLFTLPGNPVWRRIRQVLSPAFSPGKLKAMQSNINDNLDLLIDNLDLYQNIGNAIDVKPLIESFEMGVTSSCVYGIKTDLINCPEHPLLQNAKKLFSLDINLSRILSILAPKLATFLKLEFLDPDVINYFADLTSNIISERKKDAEKRDKDKLNKKPTIVLNRESQEEKRTDLLQIMMDSERDESKVTKDHQDLFGNSLTKNEIIAQGILFFIGGFDTTTSGILHCLYYLSKFTDCQQKVYEELMDIEDNSYENLSRFKYLNAVIKESLRLAPSVLQIPRVCKMDINLNGIEIPSGTLININPFVVHRDTEYWESPLEFQPDRFFGNYNKSAYIPFGVGYRSCIAEKFALNQTIMCLAKLIRKFELKLQPDFELEYYNGSIVFLPKKLMIEFKTRI